MTEEYKELRDLKFKIVDLIENNLPDVDVTNSVACLVTISLSASLVYDILVYFNLFY